MLAGGERGSRVRTSGPSAFNLPRRPAGMVVGQVEPGLPARGRQYASLRASPTSLGTDRVQRGESEKHEQQYVHMTSNHESNDRALKRCQQQAPLSHILTKRHLVPIEENAALACLAD